ncbi:carbamoyl phosphate synthase small subunit [Peribacillus tepidiphilus]|uniref:carbamoyl phosphate synthase small subunit n=1 Tax=Peribacillus tepidiphilus TaxID=2652445 RepID=UPI0035B54E2F
MQGFLHLSNGEIFEGEWITSKPDQDVFGEVVFYTGMTGYQEVLTDPSYKNQIIVFTYPLIGNYGINDIDFESEQPHVAGVIVYEGNMEFSHYNAKSSLKEYLEKWNIPMLGHVDTRALVKRIRSNGSMPSCLTNTPHLKEEFVDRTGKVVQEVSSKEICSYGSGDIHIVLMDFGYKKSILDSLLEKGCKVTVVPFNTSIEKVASLQPDGVLLSNGPGDPKELTPYLKSIKNIISSFPTMAICLGHQLVALSFGGNTEKLLFGHRGANQPVMDLIRKKVFMTSQNHSYVVNEPSLKGTGLYVRFRNINDGSVEGMAHESLPIITAQYHPEANPGPAESAGLFEEFLQMVHYKIRREKVYA